MSAKVPAAADRVLTINDIARLLKIQPAVVTSWRQRFQDFPRPLVEAPSTFATEEIVTWLDHRRIPSRDLHSEETAGSTYGARLRLALHRAPGASPADVRHTEPADLIYQQLWDLIARREKAEQVPHAVAALKLLHLRQRDADGWRLVVRHAVEDPDRLVPALAEMKPSRVDFRTLAGGDAGQWNTARELANTVVALNAITGNPAAAGPLSIAAGAVGVLAQRIVERLVDEQGRDGAFIATPAPLVDLVRRLLLVDEFPRSIYDPYCRSAEFLVGVASRPRDGGETWEGPSLAGQAESAISWQLSYLNLGLHGLDASLGAGPGNALVEDAYPGRTFDLVVCNPPFNVAWDPAEVKADSRWRYGVPGPGNANFAWLQHIASKVSDEGRAAVVMPINAASSDRGQDPGIRRGLIRDNRVEALVALPGQMFPGSTLPCALWILKGRNSRSLGEVLFVDASDFGKVRRGRRHFAEREIDVVVQTYHRWLRGKHKDVPGFAQSVSVAALLAGGGALGVRSIVGAAAPRTVPRPTSEPIGRFRAHSNTFNRTLREVEAELADRLADLAKPEAMQAILPRTRLVLGDVCDVKSGPSGALKGFDAVADGVPLVMPRDLAYNRIAGEPARIESTALDRLASYQLRVNDIICVRTGELGNQAIVEKPQDGWLFGGGCLRLRPNPDQVIPRYLLYLLGLASTRDWVRRNSTGSVIPALSSRTLRTMPLSLPPLAAQREVERTLFLLEQSSALHRAASDGVLALYEALAVRLLPHDD